jgi:hypothetical protein
MKRKKICKVTQSEKKFFFSLRSAFFFLFASKRKIRSETKRKQAKKLCFYFRLSKRKQSETDPVSLRFASKRKKILSETGAPYFEPKYRTKSTFFSKLPKLLILDDILILYFKKYCIPTHTQETRTIFYGNSTV